MLEHIVLQKRLYIIFKHFKVNFIQFIELFFEIFRQFGKQFQCQVCSRITSAFMFVIRQIEILHTNFWHNVLSISGKCFHFANDFVVPMAKITSFPIPVYMPIICNFSVDYIFDKCRKCLKNIKKFTWYLIFQWTDNFENSLSKFFQSKNNFVSK